MRSIPFHDKLVSRGFIFVERDIYIDIEYNSVQSNDIFYALEKDLMAIRNFTEPLRPQSPIHFDVPTFGLFEPKSTENKKEMENKLIGYKFKPNTSDKIKKAAEAIAEVSKFLPNRAEAFISNSFAETKLKEAGVLNLWFDPVFQETKKTVSVGGKFNVTIEDGKIYHSSTFSKEDITEYVKVVWDWANNIPTKLGKYDFHVDVRNIRLVKTGCELLTTTVGDWVDLSDKI